MMRRRPVLALYAIGLPLAFSLVRADSGSHKRYILYVVPFGILLALEGLRWAAARITPKRAGMTAVTVALVCLVWQAGIAASDIGAIGYFSHRKVVDLMGLVSKPRTLPENLSVYKPDLLIVIVDWFAPYARPDSATHFYAFYDADSTHKYTAMSAIELSHNTICAADQMVAFVRQKPGDPPPPLYTHRY